jgi:flagellar basal body-associated protein FliL
MEILLISLIVILSLAICAVAAFWVYRDHQARKRNTPPRPAGRRARHDPWLEAVRASRGKF